MRKIKNNETILSDKFKQKTIVAYKILERYLRDINENLDCSVKI